MSQTNRSAQTEAHLRADAERNRDHILRAARRLYAAQGLGVSMAAVAREAGVGKATLARRFPSRGALIGAVFAQQMSRYVDATRAALAEQDAWLAFTRYIEDVCRMQAEDRGFADVLTLSFPGAQELDLIRAESYAGFLEVIARAKRTGHLRDDFVSEDLYLVLIANAGVLSATADVTDDAWRRLVGLMLRAFAVSDAPLPPLPAAPSSADLEQATRRRSTSASHVD